VHTESSRTAANWGLKPLGARPSPGLLGTLQRSVRRQVRRLDYHLHPPKVRFVYSPAYERLVSGVPMDPLRADRILAFLANERLVRRDEISLPRPAALKNILLVHSPEYLNTLQQASALTAMMGVEVTDSDLEMVLDHQRLMCGGTIQATRLARSLACVTVNLGGGFHHAGPDRGMGFCVFNDVAIAIARIRQRGFTDPILVVDLDLHDGNGTRAAFASDPTVYTYSIHNQSWGPEEAVASSAIALGTGVADELYLGTLLKTLPGIAEAHRPGMIVYLAGCDVAADDRIGDWKISAEAIFARDRFVVELARRLDSRLVVVLAGGYGDAAWRYSARFLGWLVSGHEIEPPDNEELTLLRFRQIKRGLDPALLTEVAGSSGWELTEEDLVGILPGIPHQTRYLGYFSKVGVELLLERFGILQQLRSRGFRNPVVTLELDHPLGQTMRILSDPVERAVLVELRLQRSTRAVPGMEVLVVEWLLLQNPQQEFSAERRRLPGQQHPGLGMLRELFGWLVVIGETLELDGLFFHPSQYHLAALSRRYARFLHPGHEASYRALEEVLAGMPLHVAAAALEDGRVVDAATGLAVRWEPFPLVIPVSARLKEQVSSEAYEQEVGAALAAVRLELRPAAERTMS
jgi:acetoin utilization deacetylase AcuC-like enzyme